MWNTGSGNIEWQEWLKWQWPMMNRWNPQSKPSILPASISKTIDTKLATFPDNTSKIAWINWINSKIDALASKVTSQKSKDILTALKDLLNQKIDDMNWNNIDSSVINGLFQ